MRQNSTLEYTSRIVGAYLAGNKLEVEQIPHLMDVVHQKVQRMCEEIDQAGQQRPAVSIEHSITPDHIICLEDGKKFKMLKKHLMTQYNMTPEEYRTKWGLPADYPMVAPNYAAKRQELARASGLGKSR